MPGFNQKGPEGQGSMTGRKMGRCTNFGANLKKKDICSNRKYQTKIIRKIFREENLGLVVAEAEEVSV